MDLMMTNNIHVNVSQSRWCWIMWSLNKLKLIMFSRIIFVCLSYKLPGRMKGDRSTEWKPLVTVRVDCPWNVFAYMWNGIESSNFVYTHTTEGMWEWGRESAISEYLESGGKVYEFLLLWKYAICHMITVCLFLARHKCLGTKTTIYNDWIKFYCVARKVQQIMKIRKQHSDLDLSGMQRNCINWAAEV